MAKRKFEFALYRLNITEEGGLFTFWDGEPIRNDQEVKRLLETACHENFDYIQDNPKSSYLWSCRDYTEYKNGEFISFKFARSVIQKTGYVVTENDIIGGTSQSSPPLADMIEIFIYFPRHLVVVEYLSKIFRSKSWLNALKNIFYNASKELKFSSIIELEPIAEEHEIVKTFFSFSKLTRLKVTLRFPNPELTRFSKSLYEDLENGGIQEYLQDMKNSNGLSTEKEALPYASAELAQAGYKKGKVYYEGIKDGEHITIKSTEEASRGSIDVLQDYVRGMSDNAKSKEAQFVLGKIKSEIERLYPENGNNSN